MSAAPGTFLWLIAHDLRLSGRRFRAMFRSMSMTKIVLVMLSALGAFHLLAWPFAIWIREAEETGDPWLFLMLASAVLFVIPWVVSQALTSATRALYTRGDLDLLQASPMSPRVIFAARSLAIGIEATSSVTVFFLPVANMAALVAGPHWLAAYPAILAFGLLGTALGLWITLVLFQLAGPKRTRTIAQVLATCIGAGFALGLQTLNLLPASYRKALLDAIGANEPGTLFDREGWLWLPCHALRGEADALLIMMGLGFGLFVISALTLGTAFAHGSLGAAGAPEPPVKRLHRASSRRSFRAGVGSALRAKEWRLLMRDPWLLSQILLQILYTLPLSIVIWQALGPQGTIAISVAPALVVIASQISASLAWLTLSSEDAPEFLASAPITRGEIERRKLEAIAVPVLAIVGLPLLGLLFVEPKTALITFAFAAGAAISTALLNLWHPSPGKRGDVMRRHAQSKLVGLMEHLLSMFWALAIMMTMMKNSFAFIPVLLALMLLWMNRPKPMSLTRVALP